MKPVLILQHQHADGPAYLAAWLAAHGMAFRVRNTEAGEAYPATISGWSGLAVLGGEMGANDDLPSLRDAERLILQAMADGVPVLGHCLGGQLMARALGAAVTRSPQPEIGWQPLAVLDTPAAQAWFGAAGEHHVYQWHHDAFAVPSGAELLATGAACPNQAFAMGPHLAMQFHVEIDAEKHERWARDAEAQRLDALGLPTVQGAVAMRELARQRLAAQRALAARIYARWASALVR